MLKLAGEIEFVQCPRCRGVGSVKLEDTYGTRSNQWVRNGRVPCPVCRGKKIRILDGQQDLPEKGPSDGRRA